MIVVTLYDKYVFKMGTHRFFRTFGDIGPEETYSVREAARYLGIHRCTIYAYITHPEKPLPFIRQSERMNKFFRGADLIAYKTAGLPKRGRRRKGGKT